MKLITITAVVLGALSFSVNGLRGVYQRATELNSSLTPSLGAQATSNNSIAQDDNKQKNFTFNELFTLQKRFLDNFISPNNDIQVRVYASDLYPTYANT